MHKQQAYHLCRQYMHRYVIITTKDGRKHDGFIENVDGDNVYLAVPRGGMRGTGSPSHSKDKEGRQFIDPYGYPGYYGYGPIPDYGYGYSSYPYPGYYGGYYPYPPRRRRFRRLALPLSFLTGVALGRLF